MTDSASSAQGHEHSKHDVILSMTYKKYDIAMEMDG